MGAVGPKLVFGQMAAPVRKIVDINGTVHCKRLEECQMNQTTSWASLHIRAVDICWNTQTDIWNTYSHLL
jgi:hypothetical protein